MKKRKLRRKKSTIIWAVYALCSLLSLAACKNKYSEKPRILVFSKTAGFHHVSITKGNEALLKLGKENGFIVDTTTNATYFVDDSLQKYSSILFLNTTGNVLNHRQEAALERYVQAGGGFAGIHAATDTESHWGWYGLMVGARFAGHPSVQQATVQVLNHEHPSTNHLPEKWERTDEWYNFRDFNKEVNVLLKVDEDTYEGGENGNLHPIAWYHEYDGGRVFYTGLGHTEQSFTDSIFLQHLMGGIKYTIGDNKPLDYSKATTQNVPKEERFVKTVLTKGTLTEPTEMTILPNLDILISQRRGEIMLYKNNTGQIKQVGKLEVYDSSNSGANVEEGLLGIAADPEFEKNHYVFVFYSPADTSVNRLSRFEFRNDAIDISTEKIVLQFYSQREICCHTGGSIAFGPNNLLYVSTGDNSTPFNEEGQPYVNNGFAPLNDQPGHEQYDARRSAGNSNDLRGKILRIRIKEDGSYEIPKGNLFPPDVPKARPEIYVMGNRNPYRISVDPKTGDLYWGEVGPDANRDSLETRGPQGYDEINQAKKAGFFGWPLFVGNNFPYRQYNYTNGESGKFFDTHSPVNDSRNNTGLVNLPPAQPALIWYPYGASKDFPALGTGGRTAMAGPVYYTDLYPDKNRYPNYYNKKFFFYDWIRNWVKVASFLPDGDLDKIEPFIEHISFSAPVDMEVGPDGRIYVLEYGQGWFTKNPDAGLSRIDYISGNLPPKIESLVVDKVHGNLPLTVTAKIEASDVEGDLLSYVWTVEKKKIWSKEPQLKYTFVRPGEHPISVKVIDAKGDSTKREEVLVYAGNEVPSVKVQWKGNQSFYFPEQAVDYQVQVTDEGDKVGMEDLYVSFDYIEGKDLAGASLGHRQISTVTMGKNLMLTLDCKACHKIHEKSIGPSFIQVAEHYDKERGAVDYLSQKIIDGGNGVWGENAMPAHPSLKVEEAKKIVKWVLSLSEESAPKPSFPPQGEIVPDPDKIKNPAIVLRLFASYTDKGGVGIKPLSGSDVIYLRNNIMSVNDLIKTNGFEAKDTLGSNYLKFPQNQGWILAGKLDMTGIENIVLTGVGDRQEIRYMIEIRRDGPEGKKLGEAELNIPTEKRKVAYKIPVWESEGGGVGDIYICVKSLGSEGRPLLGTLRFVPKDHY